jgi:integrase
MRVLEPIWHRMPETASRLRGRIESVLDYAAAHGWRSGENPARWRGHLAKLLPPPSRIAKVKHHPALPWQQIGSFMAELRDQEGVAARALEFTILTAARTGEVIGCERPQVDLQAAVWIVPAARMKSGREHRVPLSEAAIAVLDEVAPLWGHRSGAWLFPGGRPEGPLSNMAMIMLLRRMGYGDLTVHGFRSTFRDWCAEATNYPREVAEAALAHILADKVEAAYRRSDLFEKRRRLMEDWARFCAQPARPAEVVPIRA